MKLIWKPIPGYKKYYEASNTGLIRSKKRVIVRSDGKTQTCKKKLMKTYISVYGYEMVRLTKHNKSKLWRVHRLVAMAFFGVDPEKTIVNHKDGNKSNNNISNLEWATNSENNLHAYATGLRNNDFSKRWVRVMVDDLDQVVLGGPEAAELLHDAGYFTDLDIISLKTSLLRCAKTEKPYCNTVTVKFEDGPEYSSESYKKMKNAPIRLQLHDWLILKADGAEDMVKKMRRLGHWKNKHRKDTAKRLHDAAINDILCYGYKVWYE